MNFLSAKVAVITSVAICFLMFRGPDALAGQQGVEQFNLLDRVQQDLTFVEDGLYGVTCWCGPFDGALVLPPQNITHGNLPIDGEWFDAVFVEGANIHWFVTYGVQTPTDPAVFSQYCTMGADTSTYSNLTEDVEDFCWTVPSQPCPTCDAMTFLDYYPDDINGGEGGAFEINPPPALAAVAEPTSVMMLSVGLLGLIFAWAYRPGSTALAEKISRHLVLGRDCTARVDCNLNDVPRLHGAGRRARGDGAALALCRPARGRPGQWLSL
jgi:hypothetical protein